MKILMLIVFCLAVGHYLCMAAYLPDVNGTRYCLLYIPLLGAVLSATVGILCIVKGDIMSAFHSGIACFFSVLAKDYLLFLLGIRISPMVKQKLGNKSGG